MMRISVLIVSYNVRDLLARCLASVRHAHQVVVIDNGSSDGSVAMVRQQFPDVEIEEHSDNRGFAVATNRAARRATGDAFLLLNPDTVLQQGGVQQMARALEQRAGASALGFRQVDENGRFQLSVGPWPWLSLDLVRRAVQRSLDKGNSWLAGVLDRAMRWPLPVPWVAGSCLLVRREAFERVGGLDERFFLYFEDIDFCLRLSQAGRRVWYDPSVTVLHHRGASAHQDEALASQAYRESQLWFWEKHRGAFVRSLVYAYQRLRGVAPRRTGLGTV
jgi:GT2 family glycosyltransferase